MLKAAVAMMIVLAVSTTACGGAQAEGTLTLAEKAALFDVDIQRRFLFDGQAACKLKTPTGQRTFVAYNMPDNAYMTGIYLGALAMRYAVTEDPADREAAGASIRALNLLCTVSGKTGLLARAAWPLDKPFDDDGIWRASPDGKHKWRGDVSSDQMDGVMYGYALAYDLCATAEEKQEIARNVSDLAGGVLNDGMRIIGFDGEPTRYGNYTPAYVKMMEPMNALLLLQLLKVAGHVTGDERFDKEYRRFALDEGYARTAVKARGMSWSVNHSDDVLLFLAYYPLLKYETHPALRELYIESLRRTWEGGAKCAGACKELNPFYAFIAHAFLEDDSGVAAGLETLRRFPLDMKWNKGTIASYEEEFGFDFDATPVSPVPKDGGPVPIDRRVKSWSAWVMDPYASAGDRTEDCPMEFNGHDYLMAYWLGRYDGHVTPGM